MLGQISTSNIGLAKISRIRPVMSPFKCLLACVIMIAMGGVQSMRRRYLSWIRMGLVRMPLAIFQSSLDAVEEREGEGGGADGGLLERRRDVMLR